MATPDSQINQFCRVAAEQQRGPDDVTAARMWARIAEQTKQPPVLVPARRRWWPAAVALGVAVVGCASVALWLATGNTNKSETPQSMRAGVTGPAVSVDAAVTAPAHEPVLRRWSLVAGETLRAEVRHVGTLTIAGPMHLSLRREANGGYRFSQSGGQLIIDDTRSVKPPRGAIEVQVGGTVLQATGALVSVRDGPKGRVTVLRGAALVTATGDRSSITVGAGRSWRFGASVTEPAPIVEVRKLPLPTKVTMEPRRRRVAPSAVAPTAATRAHAPRRASTRGVVGAAPEAPPVSSVDAGTPVPSVSELYKLAEAHLRAGRTHAARRQLVRISRTCPSVVEACDALYDLARWELAHGTKGAARRYVRTLLGHPVSPSLRAAALALRVRLRP